ncbi:MAG: hypothetical protein AAFP08_00350 [Bacteroidota bacterium]
MSIHNQSYEDLIREKRAFLLVEALKRKGVDANVDYYLKKSIEELDHLALEHGIDLEDRQEAPTTTVLTNDPSPVQSPSPPSPVPRQPSLSWPVISGITAIASFALAWWVIGSARIAAVIGLAAGVLMIMRNPEHLFARIAFISVGLLVSINTINFSGLLKGGVAGTDWELRFSEPSIVVSVGLIVLIIAAMYFHANRKS